MLKQLDKNELKELLKKLKSFYCLQKDMWKRAFGIFKNKIDNTSNFVVEYHDKANIEDITNEAIKVYDKAFKIKPNKNLLKFVCNDWILWWIRVIMDDKMVDLSYSKVRDKIKESII